MQLAPTPAPLPVLQVCNRGVRLMLAGDDGPLIDFRDELSRYGQYFSDSGNMKGATFIYVLYKLTEHVLPPEATKLEVREMPSCPLHAHATS